MGRAFGSALLRQDAVGHPGMGVTGKPGAEPLNQPGVGIPQLIRPDRSLRALRFIAEAIGDHLAHDLTGGHVAPPRQVIDHAQHVGGQFQVQGDHLHPVSLRDQG